jgi:hypothetical protein
MYNPHVHVTHHDIHRNLQAIEAQRREREREREWRQQQYDEMDREEIEGHRYGWHTRNRDTSGQHLERLNSSDLRLPPEERRQEREERDERALEDQQASRYTESMAGRHVKKARPESFERHVPGIPELPPQPHRLPPIPELPFIQAGT